MINLILVAENVIAFYRGTHFLAAIVSLDQGTRVGIDEQETVSFRDQYEAFEWALAHRYVTVS